MVQGMGLFRRLEAMGKPPDQVRAAGGLVWKASPNGEVRFALIHRPAYDDWSLPKGKLLPDEEELSAAIREVEEETGFRCEAGDEIGVNRYVDRKGRDKIVRYWAMRPIDGRFRPSREVDELRWASPSEAEDLLTYEHDRALLRSFAARAGESG
jgi:8-oxo-dGTP pyrophosphatase MutT (NUDIX family)